MKTHKSQPINNSNQSNQPTNPQFTNSTPKSQLHPNHQTKPPAIDNVKNGAEKNRSQVIAMQFPVGQK
jgi:hypothetical protein